MNITMVKNTIFVICSSLVLLLMVKVSFASEYFVDASEGDDKNSGRSPQMAWKSIAKVNQTFFLPGDTIYFKCGEIWREQLNITSSGDTGKPITYTKYGTGSNPMIRSSEKFDSWKHEGDNLYSGQLEDSSIINHYGACDPKGNRIPKYWDSMIKNSDYNLSDPKNMESGFFWSRYNYRVFYIKTSGHYPGLFEIGARAFCIISNGKNNITIDGIDCFGPSGGGKDIDFSSTGAIRFNSGENIVLKNLSIKHSNRKAVEFWGKKARNTLIENVTIDDCGTGIYFNDCGDHHIVRNTDITNIATVIPDLGDSNFVGILATNYVTIEDCYMNMRGWKGMDVGLDPSGIQFASNSEDTRGSSNGIIRRCYIKNPGETAIGLATGDNFEVSYCIIESWGNTANPNLPGIYHHFNGITVGMGNKRAFPTIHNVRIYNNLFLNGALKNGEYGALKINNYDATGLHIINNIFYNNATKYELYLNAENTNDWKIRNNIVFRNSGGIINNGGRIYFHNEIDNWQNKFEYASGNINSDPLLELNSSKLNIKSNSPCINKGQNIGISKDFYGNSVPSESNVDIGPFEYYGKSNVSMPKNLRIKIEL